MFLLVAFGAPRSQALASAQWQVAAMPCMVGRAHSTGIAMMTFPAGLDDECVGALLILFAANLILSRLVACHYLTTIGNMS